MSNRVDGDTKVFVASAAIPRGARVVLASNGTISAAGIAAKEIGTALNAAFAAGDRVTVKLRSGSGTHTMIASAALAVGVTAFTAALGKIGASASTAFQIGTVLTAAAADGDLVEVLYNAHGDTAVI